MKNIAKLLLLSSQAADEVKAMKANTEEKVVVWAQTGTSAVESLITDLDGFQFQETVPVSDDEEEDVEEGMDAQASRVSGEQPQAVIDPADDPEAVQPMKTNTEQSKVT